MYRILANDGMETSAVEYLQSHGYEVDTNHYEAEHLKEHLPNYDAIVIRSATKLRKDIIDAVAGSKLKLMIRAGVGIDNIDVEYAESKGITVRNTPNSSSASVAELVIAHVFGLARFLHASNVTMNDGAWNKKHYEGVEISGKTMGIIGFGRIGQEVAKRAHALGMHVIYQDNLGPKEGFEFHEFVDFETLLKRSDFITLHIPHQAGKPAVFGEKEFDMMKKGSYIINTARGTLIDTDALIHALDSNKLAGAGLDVFDVEPLADDRIAKHMKISLTPHIGGSTKEAQMKIGAEVCDVIKHFFKG